MMRFLLTLLSVTVLSIAYAHSETTVLTPADRTAIEQDYNAKIDALDARLKKLEAPAPTPTPEPVPEPTPDPQPIPPPPVTGDGLDAARAIVASMAPGEFRQVGSNTLNAVAPPCGQGQPYCAVQGPVAVVNSWGGGAFDTLRNDFIIHGGGHNDYAGNEVYRFSLKTLAWERATNPSPFEQVPGQPAGIVRLTDGTQAPISFHSYDGLVYVPTIDHMFALPQASYQTGTSYDSFAYLWDPATKAWQRSQKAPFDAGADRGCDYDATANEVVCTHPNGRAAFSIANRTWRVVSNWDSQDFGRTSAIDQNRRLFCSVWKATSPLACYDLTNNSSQQLRKSPAFTGNTGFAQKATSGLAWRPVDGRFYAYPGCNEVFAIAPGALTDTWTSTRYASATGPACDPNQVGIYGKWQYMPSLDVFVFLRWWTEKVWFYKPSNGPGDTADTTPSVLPSTMVAALKDGQTIDLPKGKFTDAIKVAANNVTVRGYGTTLTGALIAGRGTVQTTGQNVVVEGIAVDAPGGDGAASCFDVFAGTATIRKATARNCNMNLRTGADRSIEFTLEDVDFGPTVPAGQLQHGAYINKVKSATLRRVTMTGCNSSGHVLKSRSAYLLVEDSKLLMGSSACSRVIDASEGGMNIVRNSTLQHGYFALNADIICQGCEVGAFPDIPKPGLPGDLVLQNNTVVSDWKVRTDTGFNNPDIGPNGNEIIIARIGGGATDARVRYSGNRFVYDGSSAKTRFQMTWADQPKDRFIDEGGNLWFNSRAAAGLPALN